jgi:hypothetical protein
MPKAQLARYFHKQGVLGGFDFKAMKECKTDALSSAWLGLPDEKRKAMDADFQEIFAMSCEKGWLAIQDEAKWQLQDSQEQYDAFVEKLAALQSHDERAMVTFLDYKAIWPGAIRFCHADDLTHWRKRKNMPKKPAATDAASLEALANMIRDYFRHSEGRGNHCKVEALRRGDRDYFFAYPEDYSKHSVEWKNGEFSRLPRHPAFEVVYVYSQKDGTLDVHHQGGYKTIEPLQAMFADAILKVSELPPDPKDERVYDLNPLINRRFEFVCDVASGIEKVAVKQLRLSSMANKGDRVTVEADVSKNDHAIYDLLGEIGETINLNQYHVTQAVIAASIATSTDKPAKAVTIRLTHPNSCSLKYDERDLRLRAMLEKSGIEPQELATSDSR